MEKIKVFFGVVAAFFADNKKWLVPVLVAVAVFAAFGIGYISGCL